MLSFEIGMLKNKINKNYICALMVDKIIDF